MIKNDSTIIKSAALLATGQSGAIDVSGLNEASIFLNVSVVAGTNPTIDVIIEDSPNGTDWYTLATFTQKTAAAKDSKRITNFAKFLRANYTIGGTENPSFTTEILAVGRGI